MMSPLKRPQVYVSLLAALMCQGYGPTAVSLAKPSVSPNSPEQLIRALYKNDAAIVVAGGHDDRLAKYFDPKLTSLLKKDHAETDDSNTLPFDPLFDTNGDTAIKSMEIAPAKRVGAKSTVDVVLLLKEDPRRRKITFKLTDGAAGWRIANLTTKDWDLRALLTRLHGH